ncbi:hypothetical protein [Pseudomonas sp. Marseille-Q8238]
MTRKEKINHTNINIYNIDKSNLTTSTNQTKNIKQNIQSAI